MIGYDLSRLADQVHSTRSTLGPVIFFKLAKYTQTPEFECAKCLFKAYNVHHKDRDPSTSPGPLRHLLSHTQSLLQYFRHPSRCYDGNPDGLTVRVDQKLQEDRRLRVLLAKLHMYRCATDSARCRALVDELTESSPETLAWRRICARSKPAREFLPSQALCWKVTMWCWMITSPLRVIQFNVGLKWRYEDGQ